MRKAIFVSSGVLFILIAAGLITAGAAGSDDFLVLASAMAIPFLFTGYWNIFAFFYERRIKYQGEYFISKGVSSLAAGAFYHKDIAPPVFLILFGTVSMAICAALFGANSGEEFISWLFTGLSFIYALVLTVVFNMKLKRNRHKLSAAKTVI